MFKEEKKSPQPAGLPKEEKDKNNALLAGVIFFMLLIIVLWIMNLGTVFKSVSKDQNELLNINKLSRDFEKVFNDVGTKMNDLKKIDSAELQKYSSQFTAASSTGAAAIKK